MSHHTVDPEVDMWKNFYILKYSLLDLCCRIQNTENNAKNCTEKFLPVPEIMNVEVEENSWFWQLSSCECHYLSDWVGFEKTVQIS